MKSLTVQRIAWFCCVAATPGKHRRMKRNENRHQSGEAGANGAKIGTLAYMSRNRFEASLAGSARQRHLPLALSPRASTDVAQDGRRRRNDLGSGLRSIIGRRLPISRSVTTRGPACDRPAEMVVPRIRVRRRVVAGPRCALLPSPPFLYDIPSGKSDAAADWRSWPGKNCAGREDADRRGG